MKRAVLVCIATASILLLSLLSAPLLADSPISTKSKSGTAPGVLAPGGLTGGAPGVQGGSGGGGGGGGGTDEGDADGLSGLKDGVPLGSSQREAQRITVAWEVWWKFMILWVR